MHWAYGRYGMKICAARQPTPRTRRPAHDEADRLTHRCNIGRDIENTGGGNERNDCVEQPWRQHLLEIGGEPATGHGADPRAHDLHRDHERCGQKHRPAQRVAELRAALRVGGDPTRVVVGRTRQEARSEDAHYFCHWRAAARHALSRGPLPSNCWYTTLFLRIDNGC